MVYKINISGDMPLSQGPRSFTNHNKGKRTSDGRVTKKIVTCHIKFFKITWGNVITSFFEKST